VRESGSDADIVSELRALGRGGAATDAAREAVRRVLVRALLAPEREALLVQADDALLGLPRSPFRERAVRASAS
jgi:hypothetical protein